MPCPGPLHFSYSVDYIYDFCLLPDPDVGLSVLVCDVEHTSFHFALGGRNFVLCFFGQCPGLCTKCHSWQYTGVVHLSLQADGKVAFEDITVFGVCRPACHDSSLYFFVLVLFLEAEVLSQDVHVTLDIFYQHIVYVSSTITSVFAMFILRPIGPLSSDSSCSICCSSCGVSVHRNMSSKSGDWREILRLSPRRCSPNLTF